MIQELCQKPFFTSTHRSGDTPAANPNAPLKARHSGQGSEATAIRNPERE